MGFSGSLRSEARGRVFRVFTAVVGVLVVFFVLQRLLVPKYASVAIEGGLIREYYDSSMDHDVIFVGDCEVYANFSTVALWEEFGITSFIRGSPQQLVWQSYYLLEDTLLYAQEKPRVVVLNIMAMQHGEPQYEPYNRLTLDGMRLSPVKVRAVAASRLEDEDWLSYFLPFFRYKDHWRDLGFEDLRFFFRDPRVSVSGFMIRSDTVPVGFMPEPLPRGDYRFSDMAYSYLESIVKLTREHDIELVLIKAPNLYPFWFDEWEEQIVDFADENNLIYINFLEYIDDIGLDFSEHTFNAGLHLNVYGAEMLSRYFGQILMDEFDLPDRRSEPDTAVYWDDLSSLYHGLVQVQQEEIARYGGIESFLIGDS